MLQELEIQTIAERVRASREAGEAVSREQIAAEVADELGLDLDMPAVANFTDQVIEAARNPEQAIEVQSNRELQERAMAVHSDTNERLLNDMNDDDDDPRGR